MTNPGTSFRTRARARNATRNGSCALPHQMQMAGRAVCIGNAEAAAVLQRWNLCASIGNLGRIDLGGDDARIDAAFSENFAPWIDDQRVAVSQPLAFMRAALRGREHERAVLDRARA